MVRQDTGIKVLNQGNKKGVPISYRPPKVQHTFAPNATDRGNTSGARLQGSTKRGLPTGSTRERREKRYMSETVRLWGAIFRHGRTKPAVESTRVFRRRQPSRDVASMRVLVGPLGRRTIQIFYQERTDDIRVLERLPRRGTPSSVRTKPAGLAKARPCKWGSCPSLGLSARAFHVHLWKAQEISASQTSGKTGSNTVSGSCA